MSPPDINYPQEKKNLYGNESSAQKSKALDHQSWENEPFYDFLVNSLASRGVDEAIISMACTICTSKEEALLFLGIPTIYKSQPISDIPIKYIIPNSSSIDTSSNIHKELLDTGAPLEVDENLSLSFEKFKERMRKYAIPSSTSIKYFHPKSYRNEPNIIIHKSSSDSFEGSDSSSEIRPSISKPLVLSEQTENDPKAPESKSIYFENLKISA